MKREQPERGGEATRVTNERERVTGEREESYRRGEESSRRERDESCRRYEKRTAGERGMRVENKGPGEG